MPTPRLALVGAGVLLAALATGGFALALPYAQGHVQALVQTPETTADSNAAAQLRVQAGTGRDAQALQRLAALAHAGHAMSQRALGLVLLDAADTKTATVGLQWLNRAAKQGDNPARVSLGRLYLQGSNGVARDYAQALQWFTLAGQDKDATAAYFLGVQYANGYGVVADALQAVTWFSQAAAQGLPAAMFMLGNAYRYGDGVKADATQALDWYVSAAELEHPQAIQTLAMAYSHGEMGLAVDAEKAAHYMVELGHALKHPPVMP